MNRFERQPIKTVVVLLSFLMLISICAVEMFLERRDSGKETISITRHIRLREHNPSSVLLRTPSKEYMKKVDSLVEKQYRFEVDENGYIFPSTMHKDPDISILFLGGSTTESVYVEEDIRFPYLVGSLIGGGRKVNSINSGVSGNNSMHSIDILLIREWKQGPILLL
jgi:hypothetical protein